MANKNLAFVCYPESCDIEKAISKFKENLVYYAYILHDKDEKKPHYHVVLSFLNPTTKTNVAKTFGIAPELCQRLANLNGNIRYMLHINEVGKHIYDVKELKFYNLDIDNILENIKLGSLSDSDILTQIINYRFSSNDITKTDLLRFAIDNQFLEVYRKYYFIIRDL